MTPEPKTAPRTQLFNRFELKYLVHYREAREFVARIGGHINADRNALRDGFYKVVSLYLDSPDLACYWEKMDGEKYRRKVRLRTYGDRPEDAFVEIKQRLNMNVQKRRLKAPIAEAEATVAQICAGRYRGGVHPVYDEVCLLAHRYRLQPKLIVSYNRAAFFDRYQRDLRITFDRNIRCRNVDLSLAEHRLRGRFALPPDHFVVEVKFNDTMPRWLATSMNAMDFQVQRISKYCYGIEQCGMHLRAGL